MTADQRTADRETIERAAHRGLAPWYMSIATAMGSQEHYNEFLAAIADAVLAVLVPADQVRAEVLEAWAEFLPTSYTRGLTKRRAAEYRKAAGA
jgi:hypothetical protein